MVFLIGAFSSRLHKTSLHFHYLIDKHDNKYLKTTLPRTSMSHLARCCVVCSRSSPKTIFSCRYKVHQRNIDLLRVFFKRELGFGELCDRCYRLWYKHKRTKKTEPNSPTIGSKTRKKKPPSSASAIINVGSFDQSHLLNNTNNYYSILHSSGELATTFSQYPPIKKLKKSSQDQQNIENGTFESSLSPKNEFHVDDEYHQSDHLKQKFAKATSRLQSLEDDHQTVEQLRDRQDVMEETFTQDESLMSCIRTLTRAPRKSKRKNAPQRSPAKLDPICEYMADCQHQKLFTSDGKGPPTPFDFLYSVPYTKKEVTTMITKQIIGIVPPEGKQSKPLLPVTSMLKPPPVLKLVDGYVSMNEVT